jgi:hypothetical protein
MMLAPELIEDDTVSLQATNSPRNFNGVDIIDPSAKCPRFDSPLAPAFNLSEHEAVPVELTADKEQDSSFKGLHHLWTADEERVRVLFFSAVNLLSNLHVIDDQQIVRLFDLASWKGYSKTSALCL